MKQDLQSLKRNCKHVYSSNSTRLLYDAAFCRCLNKDMKDNKCYPCNGLGYHIETCIEYDGTVDRIKVSCACCDGTGEAK